MARTRFGLFIMSKNTTAPTTEGVKDKEGSIGKNIAVKFSHVYMKYNEGGEDALEEVIDRVFKNFCVGK